MTVGSSFCFKGDFADNKSVNNRLHFSIAYARYWFQNMISDPNLAPSTKTVVACGVRVKSRMDIPPWCTLIARLGACRSERDGHRHEVLCKIFWKDFHYLGTSACFWGTVVQHWSENTTLWVRTLTFSVHGTALLSRGALYEQLYWFYQGGIHGFSWKCPKRSHPHA